MEFILNYNLDIGNVGSTLTFVTMVRDEVLESMSDHRTILFKLQINTDSSKPSRNPRKTNWVKY